MKKFFDPLKIIVCHDSPMTLPAKLKAREDKKAFISCAVKGKYGQGFCRKCGGTIVHIRREKGHRILECKACNRMEWIYRTG